MYRLPLQRSALRYLHCRTFNRLLPSPPLRVSRIVVKATRPAAVLSSTTTLLNISALRFHPVDQKAVRIGSIANPATPAEIEDAELNHRSRFAIVRFLKRILNWLDDHVLEPVLTLRRLIHILILFVPVALTSPAVFFGHMDEEGEKTGTLWWYDFLASQMERAGPTFIKLAQWIASRTDLFPLALCSRLSKLHSNVDPHPFSYTQKVIEEAFGRPLDQVFSELNPEPLGVGAIAQVYKARLRPDILMHHPSEQLALESNVVTSDSVQALDHQGQPVVLHTAVAIKILHPRARQIVQRDLTIMQCVAKFLTLIPTIEWLSLPDEVRVFGEMMKEQLDLRGEARNLKRFNDYFENTKEVKIPKPLAAFTTQDMLLEEYEKGIPLDIFLNQASFTKKMDIDPVYDHKIADIGLDAFLHMLIFYNFIHADLHPGNIMVEFYKPSAHHPLQVAWSKLLGRELKDEGEAAVNRILAVKHDPEAIQRELEQLKKEGYSPRLVFIDLGLVNELNAVNRRNFLDLFGAIAQFDGYRTGELMVERCKTPEKVIQPDVFALRMQKLIQHLKQHTFHLGAVKIGNLLHETMNMVRAHHVKMEGDFINVVVSIMLLEGIGRQLNPDLDLLKNALPVLRDYSIKEGGKALEMKDTQIGNGHWIKVWIFLELRSWLGRNTREEEWLKLCDILCPNN
ncbi:uncharacterized protein B0P05DRAFT_588526 [Gilbertella persicaria]|uniref:uncharacterized protein n=1 Tax=Gilbertella persicaria TaxID=101096 RepID=UPI00221E7337|nr:uncharacterized protein B0P05DRAFT_588526 [Gilbertella persicaria]KAI8075495.1 hypothetical protein B0P05DRAFT_588526 [Gilbertella persicaria]